jgi:TatD DNase family protein
MYFDTHAHYDDSDFDADRDELISSLPENGVSLVVDPGSNMPSSRIAMSIAEKYPFVYFAAGVHPHDAKDMTDSDLVELEQMTGHKKCVAIGEIGLDYHYDLSPRDTQKLCFYRQMELARRTGKPVIIHEREACADVLDIVTQFKDIKGVYHCFSGSWETAKVILDQGWYLSFTGVITFKNVRRPLEVIEKMPLDRLMIETDSPYLSPVPVRGTRNNSANLKYIAAKAAEVRGISSEKLAELAMENGRRFFGI